MHLKANYSARLVKNRFLETSYSVHRRQTITCKGPSMDQWILKWKNSDLGGWKFMRKKSCSLFALKGLNTLCLEGPTCFGIWPAPQGHTMTNQKSQRSPCSNQIKPYDPKYPAYMYASLGGAPATTRYRFTVQNGHCTTHASTNL